MGMDNVHFVMPTGSTSLVGGPIADVFSSGTVSDCVCMSKYRTAYFFFLLGARAGTTGKVTMTVIPIDSVGGTATTAIPFQYRRIHTTETNTDWAWATSNSLLTTTGDSQIYILKVSADDLPQVSNITYEYVYVNVAETTADAQVGGGFVAMADPRFAEDTLDAVTT